MAVYATLCTIVVGVLSSFLSLKCEIKATVSDNNNLVRDEAKYDILSLDLSKDGDKKCGVWSSMGFETFEVNILVVLVLTLAYKMGKRICGREGWIAKRKEAKLKN